MNYREKSVINSSLKPYLCSISDEYKINSKNLCKCPSKCSTEETSHLINNELHCLNPKCKKVFNIIDLVKLFTPQFQQESNEEIYDYLKHRLNINVIDDTEELLKKYYEAGFYLFPLNPGTKIPLKGFSWTTQAVCNLEVWKGWIERGYGLALTLGKNSKVVAVDFDSKETYQKLENKTGDTLVQTTQRGMHFLYNYEECFIKTLNEVLRNDGYEMELRTEGAYIVIAPTSVDGEVRQWNNKKIVNMPSELKQFFLSYYSKTSKSEDIDLEIQQNINNEKISVVDLSGKRNATFISFAGILRKLGINKKHTADVLKVVSNNLIDKPIPSKELYAILGQVDKYNTFDKQSLAKILLERFDVIGEASAFSLAKTLGREQIEIEDTLNYLEQEGKIVSFGKNRYKKISNTEWTTGFQDYGVPIDFEIPYFNHLAYFDIGDMIIIGGKTGIGKTTLTGNFIRKLYEQKNIKSIDLISTEAGSKIGKILHKFNIPEEFVFRPEKMYVHPTSLELRDNRITIIDWLKPKDGDYAQMDNTMEHFHNQLKKHQGILLIMMQVRSNGEFFAKDQVQFYGSLVATYNWGNNGRDAENTFFETCKIRDSKTNLQFQTIPTIFDFKTKLLELKK